MCLSLFYNTYVRSSPRCLILFGVSDNCNFSLLSFFLFAIQHVREKTILCTITEGVLETTLNGAPEYGNVIYIFFFLQKHLGQYSIKLYIFIYYYYTHRHNLLYILYICYYYYAHQCYLLIY
jgi:hypothetical protein